MKKYFIYIIILIASFSSMGYLPAGGDSIYTQDSLHVTLYSNRIIDPTNWLIGSHVSKEQAHKATSLSLNGTNYYKRIPIRAEDFPNLESIHFTNCCFIISLHGITEFKKLKEVSVLLNDPIDECGFDSNERALLCDLSELWKLISLEKLYLCDIPPQCITQDLVKLNNLTYFYFKGAFIPVEVLSKFDKLLEVEFKPLFDKEDMPIFSTDLYILSRLYSAENNKNIPLTNYSRILINNDLKALDTNKYTSNYTGQYLLKYPNSTIAVSGFYNNGVRDSIWTYYNNDGTFKDSITYTQKGEIHRHTKKMDSWLGCDTTVRTKTYYIHDSVLMSNTTYKCFDNMSKDYELNSTSIVLKEGNAITTIDGKYIRRYNIEKGYQYLTSLNPNDTLKYSSIHTSNSRGVECATNKQMLDTCICFGAKDSVSATYCLDLIRMHKLSYDSLRNQIIRHKNTNIFKDN